MTKFYDTIHVEIHREVYKMKNKVIDYVTPATTCEFIGISRKSISQISLWIKQKRIHGVYKFGNNWAIPISWVKSECIERGLSFQGVQLSNEEVGVSLNDYSPIAEIFKGNKLELDRTYNRMRSNTFNGDYIKFGNAYGIRKEAIK